MDMVKMGGFLQSLRKEQGLTQAQLGEELGVAAKTISRWETGTYMPPVEMLLLLSQRYGVSINELVNGARIAPEELTQKAEENLVAALKESAFGLAERQSFWRRKWRWEHRGLTACIIAGAAAVQVIAALMGREDIMLAGAFLTLAGVFFLRNRQADYVEHHLYDQ